MCWRRGRLYWLTGLFLTIVFIALDWLPPSPWQRVRRCLLRWFHCDYDAADTSFRVYRVGQKQISPVAFWCDVYLRRIVSNQKLFLVLLCKIFYATHCQNPGLSRKIGRATSMAYFFGPSCRLLLKNTVYVPRVYVSVLSSSTRDVACFNRCLGSLFVHVWMLLMAYLTLCSGCLYGGVMAACVYL